MEEVIAWIALGISVLNLVFYLLWIKNDWKKTEIKVSLGLPKGELKKFKGFNSIELKISVDITNSGNKDTFIESMWIHHNDKSMVKGTKTSMPVASKFKLLAHTNKSFDIKFSPSYNPEEEPCAHKGYDSIFIEAIDNKNKKFIDTIYYKINEENRKIESWFSYAK